MVVSKQVAAAPWALMNPAMHVYHAAGQNKGPYHLTWHASTPCCRPGHRTPPSHLDCMYTPCFRPGHLPTQWHLLHTLNAPAGARAATHGGCERFGHAQPQGVYDRAGAGFAAEAAGELTGCCKRRATAAWGSVLCELAAHPGKRSLPGIDSLISAMAHHGKIRISMVKIFCWRETEKSRVTGWRWVTGCSQSS